MEEDDDGKPLVGLLLRGSVRLPHAFGAGGLILPP
jgi:hypothetical protein